MEVGLELQPFLTSAPDGGGWATLSAGSCTCRKEPNSRLGGMQSRSGGLGKRIVNLLNDFVSENTCCRVWVVLSRKLERVWKEGGQCNWKYWRGSTQPRQWWQDSRCSDRYAKHMPFECKSQKLQLVSAWKKKRTMTRQGLMAEVNKF